MEQYLNIIVTNGDDRWDQQGVTVPRKGDTITVRKPGGTVDFEGIVEEVHWGLRTGAAGMVVTVWITKE